MLPGILMSAGIGMSIVPSTIAATQGAKPGQAGLASGLVNTSFMMGGALGLVILASLAAARTSGALESGVGQIAALTDGYHAAFAVGAAFAFGAAVLAIKVLRVAAAAPVAQPAACPDCADGVATAAD